MSDALRDEYVETLEAEIAELREKVTLLEDALGYRQDVPVLFGLTASEHRVLGFLIKRDSMTKEHILSAVYSDRPNDLPEIKIVDVYICKIRKKVAKFGIKIDTLWGRGYSIPAESKRLIQQFVQQQGAAV